MDLRITECDHTPGVLQVFITNGWLSDVVIVVAVTNREARSPAHGISLFLVENGMKGFIKGRKLQKMGLKAQVSHNVTHIQVAIVTVNQKRHAENYRWHCHTCFLRRPPGMRILERSFFLKNAVSFR